MRDDGVREVRILLIGAGNLGRRFAQLVEEKRERLCDVYGLHLRIVGVADSGGAAVDPSGLDGRAIAGVKEAGGSVADLPIVGRAGATGLQLIESQPADVLCEAGPVNLDQGAEPGLSHVREALRRGLHVSTPNKGPIVTAFRELQALAASSNRKLRFDGTVAGGLPALALGARDLRGATIERIEAIPNLTTGFILDLLASGNSWDTAVETAREAGALEGDGAWDIDGWDAAAKLAILAQSVLDLDVSIADVARTGIREIDLDRLRAAHRQGTSVRLLASAVRSPEGDYTLRVAPQEMPHEHPLARLGSKGMGIVYETDLFATITASIDEPTPLPSAASMLRDVLDLFADAT